MQWKTIKLYKNEEDLQEVISRSEFQDILLSEKNKIKEDVKESMWLFLQRCIGSIIKTNENDYYRMLLRMSGRYRNESEAFKNQILSFETYNCCTY